MPIEHWMMFGTFAEQRHFMYPDVSVYSGVIINANMVAHAKEGLANFLCERTKLPYIIDPLTHAFQHEPTVVLGDQGEPKRAFATLAQAYGEPVSSCIGIRPVLPEDFEGRTLKEFVVRCLKYQRESLSDLIKNSPVLKYMDEDDQVPSHPQALVAPYFYLTEASYKDWLPTMVNSVRLSIDAKQAEEKVYASIVISKGVLTHVAAKAAIISRLGGLDLDGFLLWVDDFNEAKASENELLAFLQFASDLRKGDRKVINLHGGYFSTLASGAAGSYALSGVTHGPEFGEFRAVVPVGGGIPIARYYLPKLHLRLRYRDALGLLTAKQWLDTAERFHTNVCDCQECLSVIAGDPENFRLFGETTPKERLQKTGMVRIDYPTSATKLRCLRHYLNCKKREFDFASQATPEEVESELMNGIQQLYRELGIEGVGNLNNWQTALALHRQSKP